MKNIHVLPTDKPSRLLKSDFKITLLDIPSNEWKKPNINIYITSDEEIKEGDWVLWLSQNKIIKCEDSSLRDRQDMVKKIILTTDQDLIKDGVQAIDDEFLEWFIKNPSCENVEVKKECCGQCDERLCEVYDREIGWTKTNTFYKIIIPKEEPKQEHSKYLSCCKSSEECHCDKKTKQETLEEVALNYAKQSLLVTTKDGFIAGAKWQAERMYSEEEVRHLMTLAFEQGFKKADIVEAGLEAKETDTEVNWIFLKHKK